MKYPWAVPGAKVERISGIEHYSRSFAYPEKGRAYTIRSVFECPVAGGVKLRLVGVDNKVVDFGVYGRMEPGFGVENFRPLITQSDDVAKFTHLLNTTDLVVDA